MADNVDQATRSRIMRAVKSRDTGPELAVALALRLAKVQFSRRTQLMPGRPDFVMRKARLAVEIATPSVQAEGRVGAKTMIGSRTDPRKRKTASAKYH